MRKSNREVTKLSEILNILDSCQTLRLGINGSAYPYVVPLSFGWEYEGEKLSLYFHCAKEGQKIDMLSANSNVCAEVDALGGYVETGHSVTADYKSVIMFGTAERVFGEDEVKGLDLILKHCRVEGHSARECVALGLCAVYRINVHSFTAKKRF